MFVPVTLGSDKTTVSVGTGDNEFWPLYGSVGNLHNNMRRAHGAGFVLIGFLVIPKGIPLRKCSKSPCPIMISAFQLTKSMLLILRSGDSVDNCSIHPYQKSSHRFVLSWKNPKL